MFCPNKEQPTNIFQKKKNKVFAWFWAKLLSMCCKQKDAGKTAAKGPSTRDKLKDKDIKIKESMISKK